MATANPGSGRNQSGTGNSARRAREKARVEREAAQAAAKRRRTVTTVVIAVVVIAVVAGLGGLVAWQRNKSDPNAAAPRGVVPSYTATASPAPSTTPAATTSPSASPADTEKSTVDPDSTKQSTSTAPGMGWGVGAGKTTAPVTLELFEDFSCPHCADLETTLGSQVKNAVAEGSVKLVYYPMTLSGFGRPTELAANAFACASDLGKAEEYHDALYANYDTANQQWTTSMLTDIGKSVGLTSSDFGRCVRNDTYSQWVKSMDDTGDARGVQGTPTAFINGKLVPAESMSADGIMQAIAAAALSAK